MKKVKYKENQVSLHLWDIAGQERFANMTHVYYKDAVGAVVVFDVTSRASVDKVRAWADDVRRKVHLEDGAPIPAVLFANKCDHEKEKWAVTEEDIAQLSDELQFTAWRLTSCKLYTGIEEGVLDLIKDVVATGSITFPSAHDSIRLEAVERKEKKKPCCGD